MILMHNGEQFTGTPEGLKSLFDAKGYQAQRENKNPHEFWQVSEYIKREISGKDSASQYVPRPRPRYSDKNVSWRDAD